MASLSHGGIHTDRLVAGGVAADNLVAATTGTTPLYGGAGMDHLYGTYGNHETVFIGGGGTDYLFSGTGKNIFTYLAVADSTVSYHDTIGNSHDIQDVIDLHAIDADPGKAGLQPFSFIGSKAFTSPALGTRSMSFRMWSRT